MIDLQFMTDDPDNPDGDPQKPNKAQTILEGMKALLMKSQPQPMQQDVTRVAPAKTTEQLTKTVVNEGKGNQLTTPDTRAAHKELANRTGVLSPLPDKPTPEEYGQEHPILAALKGQGPLVDQLETINPNAAIAMRLFGRVLVEPALQNPLSVVTPAPSPPEIQQLEQIQKWINLPENIRRAEQGDAAMGTLLSKMKIDPNTGQHVFESPEHAKAALTAYVNKAREGTVAAEEPQQIISAMRPTSREDQILQQLMQEKEGISTPTLPARNKKIAGHIGEETPTIPQPEGTSNTPFATEYGLRAEVAQPQKGQKAYRAIWSNNSASWILDRSGPVRKGDIARLDANEVLVYAKNQSEANAHIANMDQLPLYEQSYEWDKVRRPQMGQLSAEDGGVANMARTGEGTVGAGLDPSLFKKLGANMYSGNIAKVAVKEGLQNAVDAVREVGGKGSITAKIYPSTNTLHIVDSGAGMTPEIMTNQFLDVGGSAKASSEASGGYGLAKVGLFTHAQDIHVQSVAEVNGEKLLTELTGSGEDWIRGRMSLTSRKVPTETPTGTDFKIQLDPETKPSWEQAEEQIRAFSARNKIDGEINFTGYKDDRTIYPRAYGEDYGDNPSAILQTPESEIRVYHSQTNSIYPQGHILNNGMYQHEFWPTKRPESGPSHILFDVRPKVSTDDPLYPFTTSREQIKGATNQAIEGYFQNMQRVEAISKNNELITALANPLKVSGTDYGVFRTTTNVPDELAKVVADRPYAKELSNTLGGVFNDMFKAIKSSQEYQHFDPPRFAGLSLGDDHLAVNVLTERIVDAAESVGLNRYETAMKFNNDTRNMIMLNPYKVMAEAKNITMTKGGSLDLAAARRTWGSLLHEIAHQGASGHNEAFAGIMTRIPDHVFDIQDKGISALQKVWQKLINDQDFHLDRMELEDAWNSGKSSAPFKEFIGHEGQ